MCYVIPERSDPILGKEGKTDSTSTPNYQSEAMQTEDSTTEPDGALIASAQDIIGKVLIKIDKLAFLSNTL